MDIFGGIGNLLGGVLGWVMGFIYSGIPNYFLTIILFTVLVRALMFPLSLKSQKSQADKARLAPRLERLQKKYAKDSKKLQAKQQALYEKEGVSMAGGCLPSLLQMVILFGVISVIYSPLTHLVAMPSQVTAAAIQSVAREKDASGKEIEDSSKISENDTKGYYKELRMLKVADRNRDIIIAGINNPSRTALNVANDASEEEYKTAVASYKGSYLKDKTAEQYYEQILQIRSQFMPLGDGVINMLENPWDLGFSWMWLLPLLSGVTAFLTSWISMQYTKKINPVQNQPGMGCTTNSMLIFMPAFSLFITFTVPGGVGFYWICSNLVSLGQTLILNKIYNPAEIRAKAEAEYEEQRRQRIEDKKRLKEAHRLEDQQRMIEEQRQKNEAAEKAKATKKKEAAPSQNPNKQKRRQAAEATEETVSAEAPVDERPDETQD